MKKTLWILPLVLLASALALTACGGGGSSSSGGGGDDETAIEEAIETAATSSDPSKCTEVQTRYFNETESGKSGAASLKACEQEVEEGGNQAESVTVSNIQMQGEEGAAAEATIEGSALNGQTVAIALEKEEGAWKVDGFMGFTQYDSTELGAAFEEALIEEEGVEPELASCIGEGVAEMSQEEADELLFEKVKGGLEEITAACQG